MMNIDIVTPIFNEELGIATFLRELEVAISGYLNNVDDASPNEELDINIILVNDGSTDNTLQILNAKNFQLPTTILSLSRNFGHQSAVWAGIETARENAFIVVMDSDMQDPPRELARIFREFISGYEVVLMQRVTRKDTFFKRQIAGVFYKLQRILAGNITTENVGDFYGLAPNAKAALLQHHESVKYLRGLVAQLGFKRSVLKYDREERLFGTTHYTVARMFSLALAGLTGFSISPLVWVVYSAFFGAFVGVSLILYVLYLKLFSGVALVPGWAFVSVTEMMLSVIILSALAIMSLYLARVVQELKSRPIYLARSSTTVLPKQSSISKGEDEVQ